MKIAKVIVLLLCLLALQNALQAQGYSIQGTIYDAQTNAPLPDAELVHQSQIFSKSDSFGEFNISDIPAASSFELIVYHEQYNILDTIVQLEKGLNKVNFFLNPLAVNLDEVQIVSRRKEIFGIRQLRDIEGTTINAGKKTEVVVLENINANFAENKSRQIFAQVSGLNIYEGSDGGLQLAIGGRGLDPNRTSNFNTRQNGYDISADVLGYPESYYTPPASALKEIQFIRGASSLQYGTQFGGLINFKINPLDSKNPWAVKTSQSIGSFGLFDSFNQISYKKNKWQTTAYYNFKRGNGYRENSEFESNNFYVQTSYQVRDDIKLSAEFTYYNYLAQQAGGLTDQQFEETPRLSTRSRNWFDVDWKLFNFKYEQNFSTTSKLSLNLFALDAERNAVGFRGNINSFNTNPILALDEQDSEGNFINPRDVLQGNFDNYGAEVKFLNEFSIRNVKSVLLTGAKWYSANNTSIQGPGTLGTDADFSLTTSEFPDYPAQSSFEQPNRNFAFFGENIFYLNDKWSVTPGFRFEHIQTGSIGTFNQVVFDNAGNPIANTLQEDDQELSRRFLLLGAGVEYKPTKSFNIFGNISQNYRSVTFSDIRVVSPSFIIDPDISDESGFTFDIGIRGRKGRLLSYNIGAYGVFYDDRIGIIFDDRANRVRTNIGDAFISGLELLIELDVLQFRDRENTAFSIKPFLNLSATHAEYLRSENQNVSGNTVEFVPTWNIKSGLKFKYENFQASLLFAFVSEQFTDAQNSPIAQNGDLRSGIVGEIPAYSVADFTLSYTHNQFTFSSGINNIFDNNYFTRRATGYPGPGIIPSQGRSFHLGITYQFVE